MQSPPGLHIFRRTPRHWQRIAGRLLARGAGTAETAATLRARGCPAETVAQVIDAARRDLAATQNTLLVIGALLVAAGIFVLGLFVLLAQAPQILQHGAVVSLSISGVGLVVLLYSLTRKVPLP